MSPPEQQSSDTSIRGPQWVLGTVLGIRDSLVSTTNVLSALMELSAEADITQIITQIDITNCNKS